MTLFGLFGDRAGARAEPATTAPGTTIRYDAGLVPRLVEEHRHLVRMYLEVQAALVRNDRKGIQTRLIELRAALQEHFVTENVKLYIYLGHHLADDVATSHLVHDMRREVMHIGRYVMGVLRRYTEVELTTERMPEFRRELDAVGVALTQRIEREEHALYPLYLERY